MKRLTFLMTSGVLILIFAGCGQSGPLYVPGNPSQMAVPPEGQQAAENEQEEEQE